MALTDAHAETRLPAQDLDRARRWYREKLGLEPTEEREGGLRYVVASGVFCLFESAGAADGSFTQLALTVDDLDAEVARMRANGVDLGGYGIVEIAGNYPSKGSGERATWFRDSEGNLIGLAETVR